MTTDWAIFKALPADERDRLGYAKWQEESRIGTHGPGCYAWGPAHWACACREIEALQASANTWINPISRMPTQWQTVLVQTSCGAVTVGCHARGIGWHWEPADDEDEDAVVAYWQPLPKSK